MTHDIRLLKLTIFLFSVGSFCLGFVVRGLVG